MRLPIWVGSKMNKLNYALIILVVVLAGSLIYQSTDVKASTLASIQSAPPLQELPQGWQELENAEYGIKVIVPLTTIGGESCVRPMAIHQAKDGTMGRFGDPKVPVWDWLGPDFLFVGAYHDCPGVVQNDGASGFGIHIERNITTVKELQYAVKQSTSGACKFVVGKDGQWTIKSVKKFDPLKSDSRCGIADIEVEQYGGKLEGFYHPEEQSFVYWVRKSGSFSSPGHPDAYEKFRIEKLDI